MPNSKENSKSSGFKKYLSGTLTEGDKKAFEESFEQDSFEQEALEGFSSLGNDEQALAAIKNIEKKISKQTGLKQGKEIAFPIWKSIGIAASVVVLFGMAVFMTKFFKNEGQMAHNNVETEDVIEDEIVSVDEPVFEVDVLPQDTVVVLEDIEIPLPEVKSLGEKEEAPSEQIPVEPELAKPNLGDANSLAKRDDLIEDDEVVELAEDEAFDFNTAITTAEKSSSERTVQEAPAAVQTESLSQISDSKEEAESVKKASYFQSGKMNYDSKNYNLAISYFQNSLDNNIKTTESQYYIAMSFYNLNKYNKAIKAFDAVISKSSSSLVDNAKWYKAIILVEKGMTQEAINLLTELANGNSGFKNQAKDKLNSLN